MDTLCQVDSNLQHSQLHPLVTVLLFVFRLVMRGHACTSSPTPPQTRAQTSCMLNTTWAEEHSELARKEQNFADGTVTCQLSTIGSIFVSFLLCLVSIIFPDYCQVYCTMLWRTSTRWSRMERRWTLGLGQTILMQVQIYQNFKSRLNSLVGWPWGPPHPWTGSRCNGRWIWQVN